MVGEVLTWLGVAAATLLTFGLYRSVERANRADADETDDG
jgi:hypothetical protein